MKSLKSFLLLSVWMFVICGVSFAQKRTDPDNAKYFIKGNLSIEGDSYKLSDIQSQGISFDNPGSYIMGTETEREDVRFTFSRYDTDYPGGKDTKLQFWRYIYGEWVPDGETRQGSREMSEKKSMVVMLVLDCSNSMASDINSMKSAAKNLVNTLYNTSSSGNGNSNIKIGYVTFSTVGNTEVSDIKPLTSTTKMQLESVINSITTNNGTALYYAMDKAIEKIELYCNTTDFSNEPLSSVTMLTFTDGLDQGSLDKGKGIRDGVSYYNYFISKYKGKHINGLPLISNIIGVRGNDIISDNQWNSFKTIGRSLSEEINPDGSFKTCNISQLSQEFQSFAENLVNQWKVLNLYVPNAFQGPVAWTFFSQNEAPKPQPVEKSECNRRMFVGLNWGGGITMEDCYFYGYENGHYYNYYGMGDLWPKGNMGLDVAFPLGKGGANLGFHLYGGFPDAGLGPLLLINFRRIPSLYLSSGVSFNYMSGVMDWGFRIGFATKKHFYMFFEASPVMIANFYGNDYWTSSREQWVEDGYYDTYGYYHSTGHYETSYYSSGWNVVQNIAFSLNFGVHFGRYKCK